MKLNTTISLMRPSDLDMVARALVTSCLDCCNLFYVGLPLKSIWKPQLIQNAAAKLLVGAGYRKHVTPLLQPLAAKLFLGSIQSADYYL